MDKNIYAAKNSPLADGGTGSLIILAGGLGTRLRSVVSDLPKCMAPVNGKPFLNYVIDYFQQQNITQFIFSLGYKHEVIIAYLEQLITHNSSFTFHYSIEKEPLGTGGAIKKACEKVNSKNVFVTNGDTLFKASLPALNKFHLQKEAECTLALKPMINFSRYGVVELNENGSVKNFCEKKYYKNGLINGGLYMLNVENFLSRQLPEKFSFETGYLEKFYKEHTMYGLEQDGYFIDIGIPEDYERVQKELVKGVDWVE
ncbi:nucleotidyltransferase family protein [Parafilimonas terrae]|uniref:D-glycero-alpha-D-manno-heptose 1-phosphate guanylyltransferase n=1 Tax=Parafilimonas terrae TaxID=1465490 RepID=A0A1I5YUT8_9BACT|nr:nucleotidyltransferase family protein [Parafilimonas terrae]SFQ48004.1 D-glycero-alpha-D-manno-heptose 1-phosphate guanylyltransferase [Parafilimonas terrae]